MNDAARFEEGLLDTSRQDHSRGGTREKGELACPPKNSGATWAMENVGSVVVCKKRSEGGLDGIG